MATGHPDVWQQRKKMHERPGVPEIPTMSVNNKELNLSDSEESDDDTFCMQPEESVPAVTIRANNKRKENERVLETLLETPKFYNKKVQKLSAGDYSPPPPFRRREEKKREKSTGHPAAVLGTEKRAGGKKTGEFINDFPQTQSDNNRPFEGSSSDTFFRGGQGSTSETASVQRQLFSNGEKAMPTNVKTFNPGRRRYLSRNQLGAVFVCVEGCSYTVTNGISTISEDDVGSSWKNNLRMDLENLGTEKYLFLVGNDSRKAWKDIKTQFPSSVQEIYLDDTHAGKCTYCEKSECHRWKVIVAGLQTMVKFKTSVIEH